MFFLIIIIISCLHCVQDAISHAYDKIKIRKWKNQKFWDPKQKGNGSVLITVSIMIMVVIGIVLNEYPLFNIPKFSTIIKIILGLILYIAVYNIFYEYVLKDKNISNDEKVHDTVSSYP